MARLAIRRCMRAHQRKAIRMLPDSLYPDLPTAFVMAILAIRAQLTSMDIRVTRRTVRSYFLEVQRNVA